MSELGDLTTTVRLAVQAINALGKTLSTRLVTISAGPQTIDFGTAPPLAGTFAQGSIRYNSAATVGQPKGWQCTVAGTPGTWLSMGNL